jgi:hypothetical protein
MSFAVVKRVGSGIELSVAKAELETDQLEAWTRERITGKLPGPAMRLSELLGAEAVDQAGRSACHVHDVRLVQDGPLVGGFGASLRVDGLLVGRRAVGARLGL